MLSSNNHSELENFAKVWRVRLKEDQSALRASFEQTEDVASLLNQHARLVDELLRDLWQKAELNKEVCLIAVGGYGRGELFPYSDVDLLILLPEDDNAALNQRIESIVGIFWDIGLAVGHSVRNLHECIDEANKDVTVQTNLLEARHLTGNPALYKAFKSDISTAMDTKTFFQAKMHEQEQRHKRFNDTAYNLEPNIKESPGGLRDLQNVMWIARSLGLGDNWNALVRHELITTSEMRQIRRHERHLQMLRTRLHYLAHRREDRLIFDFQNDLARQLGFTTNAKKRASEQLMHSYYRSAKFVSLINEILLLLLEQRLHPQQDKATPINEHFEARNGLLEAKSTTLLQRQPSTILESFLVLAHHPELTGMSANLLRTLLRVRKLVNSEFRNNPDNKHLFMEILRQPSGVTRLNRYGILGSYIPAFGRIIGQMQHDLFHVYTVDEHILNVLRNLRRFALPQYAHEFPLCSQLFAGFDKPELLYIAALFHDIAKGRGGDHSTLGSSDARRFCKSHGLSKVDSELVAWLVESHLTMSSIAQKSDLSNPAVIENFTHLMGNERRLTALYLLTVADIRGTSPKVWNAWKAKLLENLFLATQRQFKGVSKDTESELLARQNDAKKILSHYGVLENSYNLLWDKMGRHYFLRHDAQEIAWHSRLLLTHINSPEPIVRARLSPGGDGIQVLIYTQDKDDLFARICSFFERIGYTILEAKVHTTQHGYALDSFLVLDQSDKSVRYRDLLSFIEYELSQKLVATEVIDKPLQGRLSRQVKHMPINASIHIRADSDSNTHALEIIAGDRPGLLSTLAHIFLQQGVHLQTAKINTLGKRAEDTFLISSKNGEKLEEDNIKSLEQALIEKL
ncbi:MAG TPA: [protein-PII] uridylyltransferase [Methylophilaceae bacterium]|nr:[protein-PII] uridylyltransferase [Methylophilaceae bacterium]